MEIDDEMGEGHLLTAVADRSRLLLPPKILNFSLGVRHAGANISFSIAELEVTRERTNDLSYYKPTSGYQCWDAELPCSQALTYEDIRLRDPQSGIGRGFVRVR
jgi:hypothetical protein